MYIVVFPALHELCNQSPLQFIHTTFYGKINVKTVKDTCLPSNSQGQPLNWSITAVSRRSLSLLVFESSVDISLVNLAIH